MLFATILAGAIAMSAAAPKTLAPTDNIVQLALATPELSTLVAALKAADLVSALESPGPFTVFAPTNKAFDNLPEGTLKKLLEPENKALLTKVLTYHVARGNVQAGDLKNDEKIPTLEGSNVTAFVKPNSVIIEGGLRGNFAIVEKANIEATNGVVHIVDAVLIPPGFLQTINAEPTKNIVELAIATPELSTLVTAVKAAGLVETLEGAGPFTVFAPTNEAFAKLPRGVLDMLLKPENKDKLAAVLTYHVVAANIQAKDIKNDEEVKTVNGEDVRTAIRTDRVFIIGNAPNDYAEVVTADVEATNGVVHVIDHVLLPSRLF